MQYKSEYNLSLAHLQQYHSTTSMQPIYCRKRKHFPKNTSITYQKPVKKSLRSCRPKRPPTALSIKPSLWQDIVEEETEFENYVKKEQRKNFPIFECEATYLKRELYPFLVPIFEKLCAITLKTGVVRQPVRFFSFLDMMCEVLYNTNPAHIERRLSWVSCHQVFEDRRRPYYPYHWFLTPDEAATIIQALIRGVLTRCKYNLEEMKEERRKILEGIEKQKRCYDSLKDNIEAIYVDPPEPKKPIYDPCNQQQV